MDDTWDAAVGNNHQQIYDQLAADAEDYWSREGEDESIRSIPPDDMDDEDIALLEMESYVAASAEVENSQPPTNEQLFRRLLGWG